MTADGTSDRLDSWKAIANYLGRSVRTARRRESEEGLPVHRHRHNTGGSVFAYRDELDKWRDGRAERTVRPPIEAEPEAAAVAVLPFRYLGSDESRAYIADGFTEEITTALSRVDTLRVISWTSSMTLKDSRKGARAIGRSLGVGRLVEGTVRHEAERIRISARLIDVESDSQLWVERFDAQLDELFDIQERIAQSAVAALDLGASDTSVGSSHNQPDIVAWQFLVQARQAGLRWHKAAIDEAVALLEAGLAHAPDEPRLHAALGMTHLHYREAGVDFGPGPIQAAEASVARLAELAPGIAAGHRLAGWIHYGHAEIANAVRELRAALALEPWDPDALSLLANCLLISGRVDDARPFIDTLLRIDPLTPLTRCMPGWADALDGDFDAAIGPYRAMFEADPGNPFGRLFLVYMVAAAGQRVEAETLAHELPASMASTPPGQVIAMFASALGGEPLPALPAEMGALLSQSSDVLPRMIGQAYAIAGDTAETARWIAIAAERGFIHYPFLAELDPFLSAIEPTPEWEALLQRVEQQWKAFDA